MLEEEVIEQETVVETEPAEQLAQEEATESVDVPAPEQEPQQLEGEVPPAVDAYTPNFNYKVYGEEREFPEFLQQMVKDQETEEKLRGYLSKADGFEPLKEKYDTTRTERDDFKNKYESMTGDIGKLSHFVKNDRLSAYDMLGISQDQLLEDASKLIELREMDPQQRQEFEAQRHAQQANYDLENKMGVLEQQNQELLRQQHEFKLDQELAKPDVTAVSSHYDAKFGPGSFKNKVIHNAYIVQSQTGRDMSVEEAVQEIVGEYTQLGLNFNQAPRPSGASSHGQSVEQPVAREVPKSLPNLGSGRGVSPTAPTLKSIDDLRRLRQERYGS